MFLFGQGIPENGLILLIVGFFIRILPDGS